MTPNKLVRAGSVWKSLVLTLSAALLFGASARNASADYETWLGNYDNVWNDEGTAGNAAAENWSGRYGNNEVPYPYDIALFSQPSANMSLVFTAEGTPSNIAFQNTGSGYTLGTLGSTYGLSFQDYTGAFIEATLAGHGGGDTINAPVIAQGRFFLGNFSPATAEPTLANEGVAGYNNPLTIAGPISMASNNGGNSNLFILGDGNINLSGNISTTATNSPGNVVTDMVGAGTATFSGTNSFTGNVQFGGNVVLDYTTNNTQKFDPSGTLAIGYQYTNYNGNVPAAGGNITILGNQFSATTVTSANTQINGSSTILAEGGPASAPTTVNLGNLYQGTYGAALDLSSTGTVDFQTTSGNSDNILLGQGVTVDKNYLAQNDGNGNIIALTSDDGSSFSASGGNYTVNAGVGGVQTLGGGSEGANSIRFANAADGTDVTSAHTLDLGTGTLYMDFGTVLVGQDVTGNTAITDGTISDGRTLDITNYSSGVLNISANISDSSIAINGGMVELSGNNTVSNPGFSFINSGTLILGSNNGLGQEETLSFGSSNSTLALNGYNVTVSRILSNGDYIPGNAAAAAGLNSNITNTVAGTISTITVESASDEGGSADGTDLYGFNNGGTYTGGLNESSGAIIALNIQGSSYGPMYFILGSSNPGNFDVTNSNTENATGAEGTNTVFTGGINIGSTGALAYTGYGFVETTGIMDLNGLFGINGQQSNGVGITYLTGTGAVAGGYSAGYGDLYISEAGSVADTFAGNFGTSSYNANTALYLGGTGELALSNGIYNSYITTTGTSTLVAPGQFGNSGINVTGESTFIVDGTGGNELGGDQLFLYGGTLDVAPTGSGQNVVVTGADNRYYNQMQLEGGSQLILNQGANSSLTVELGSTAAGDDGQFNVYSNYLPGLSIGSVQGLSALGNTDKFIILEGPDNSNNNSAGSLSNVYIANVTDGIVLPFVVGVNDSAGSTQNATFLTYNGTGATTDQGYTPYTYSAGNIDNIAASTGSSVELMNDSETLSQSTGVYALEMDNKASLTIASGQQLNLGNGTTGGVILNGDSSIEGTVNLVDFTTSFYTDLGNGSITTLDANGNWISKDGPGTLFVGNASSVGLMEINEGALNLANGPGGAEVMLAGGVLESNGTLNEGLGNQGGDVYFLGGSSGGGFSAQGGDFYVSLAGGSTLVWGSDAGGTSGFLAQSQVFNFGSTTANSGVFLENNINLGVAVGGNDGGNAIYSRIIDVTANSADATSGLDPFDYADYAQMDGNISSSNPYLGLSKTGNGVLFLTGQNTYTGATMIAGGTLEIYSDSNLGTAPTAAYALNATPGVTGNALTPGAIEINGGAALGAYGTDVILDSTRQILLASGATGATPSIIDVVGNKNDGYDELDFGGIIADYVGEVGSLQKQGGGLFDYSGTSYNTGADSVVAGTFEVSGGGSVNSTSGVTINNQTSTSAATFNYASTVGLSTAVSYGSGGGTFAYNSAAAYTGSASLAVNAKDILTGSGNLGTTGVTIGSGGTVLPGQADPSPGTLTMGATTFMQGGNYNFLIADATGAAGTGYSTIAATTLNIASLTPLSPFNINLESLSGTVAGNAADFNPADPYSFTLVSTTGGITGLALPGDFDVYTVANNGTTGFSNSTDGIWTVTESLNGDNLLLNYTPTEVPEPSTYALLGLGLAGLLVVRRFRRLSTLA